MSSDAANAYTKAEPFMRQLRRFGRRLTPQQYRTLKGQALAGDIEGAVKGLGKILEDSISNEQ